MIEDRLRLATSAGFLDLTLSSERVRSNETLIEFYFQLLAFIQPATLIEVGAFDAYFSKRARDQFHNSRVLAFEGNPFNYDYQTSVFDFSSRNIDYRNLAISDQVGIIDFQLQTVRDGMDVSRLRGDNGLLKRLDKEVCYETVSVATSTIDIEVSKLNPSVNNLALWIDVEGANGAVLSGAKATLPQVKALFIEVEEKPYWEDQWLFHDVDKFLDRAGFRPIARDFETPHQFNVIFVHETIMEHYLFSDRLIAYIQRLRGSAS